MEHTPEPRIAPHPPLRKYYARDADRLPFVVGLFDGSARHYDWICGVGSFGSGRFYRRWTLGRHGLRPGMKLLDVATGTGLVAKAALSILQAPGAVVGLDPSAGMLREARKSLAAPLVQGLMEELPFADDHFDFLTMGYALRHVADLGVAFKECLRVLKPGGRLLVLEISRPRTRPGLWLAQAYFRGVLPLTTRLMTGSAQAALLMRYYWDTIAECVPPDAILGVLAATGFARVERRVHGGFLSEYAGLKPPR